MTNRYHETVPHTLTCDSEEGCGNTSTASVTIDRASGVAAFTCPVCGLTQEPIPE